MQAKLQSSVMTTNKMVETPFMEIVNIVSS